MDDGSIQISITDSDMLDLFFFIQIFFFVAKQTSMADSRIYMSDTCRTKDRNEPEAHWSDDPDTKQTHIHTLY